MYCIIYERAPSQVTKNTNKFIKDYDAPQAFTKQAHPLMHAHCREGRPFFLLHVIQLYSENNILFVPKQRQVDS